MVRGMEIASEVADSARSTIVEQVANGVSVRMAVLYLLLGGAETQPAGPGATGTGITGATATAGPGATTGATLAGEVAP
jgi:aspartate carbamoyltransferase catalytic subunit